MLYIYPIRQEQNRENYFDAKKYSKCIYVNLKVH